MLLTSLPSYEASHEFDKRSHRQMQMNQHRLPPGAVGPGPGPGVPTGPAPRHDSQPPHNHPNNMNMNMQRDNSRPHRPFAPINGPGNNRRGGGGGQFNNRGPHGPHQPMQHAPPIHLNAFHPPFPGPGPGPGYNNYNPPPGFHGPGGSFRGSGPSHNNNAGGHPRDNRYPHQSRYNNNSSNLPPGLPPKPMGSMGGRGSGHGGGGGGGGSDVLSYD